MALKRYKRRIVLPPSEPGVPPAPVRPPSIDGRIVKGQVTDEFVDSLRLTGLLAHTKKTRPPKFLFFGDPENAKLAKVIPFAHYDARYRRWELPVSYETMRHLVRNFPGFYMSEVAAEEARKAWAAGKQELQLLRYLRDLKEGRVDCSDVVGTKLQPRHYQQVGIKFIEEAWRLGYGVGNFDEQGLGKTCTALIALDRFLVENPDEFVVVFAPKSILHSVWVKEIVKFASHIRPLVLDGSIKKRAKMVQIAQHHEWTRIISLGGVERTEFIVRQGRPNLFLVNHEAGGMVEKTSHGKKVNPLFQALIELKPKFVIVDEVHKVANISANRSMSITRVARASGSTRIMGMTGTPGLPLHLFGVLKFIDPRIYPVNRQDFETRYVQMLRPNGMRQYQIVTGYQRLDELERRSSQFSIRRTQDECPDIPRSISSTIEIGMSEEQAAAYDATAKKVMTFYEDHNITKINLPGQLHALRNITCGHVKDAQGSVVHFKKNGKLTAVLDLLKEELAIDPAHPSTVRKAIIACAYKEDVRLVAEALETAGIKVVVVTGEVVDTARTKARTEAASLFVEDPAVQVLVGITSTFGVGLNLVPTLPQVCDLMLFYSNSYDFKERDQAEKRIQRSGQTRMCRFMDVVARGTIDETILEIMTSKKSAQDIITGDTLRFALLRGKTGKES